jgi:hypothetical protein
MFLQILQLSVIVTAQVRAARLFSLCLVVFLVGCATSGTSVQIDKLETSAEKPRILIMTPDVKYFLLTVGGVPQPHAEWTEAARTNFAESLQDYTHEHQITAISLNQNDQLSDSEISYQKLYSAVGLSILNHHYGALKLPTKKRAFDWSLGPGINVVGNKYGADYALFSYYRDYQASGGRVAFSIIAALAGVAVAAGGEIGFASLVDLRTGDIVWFNKVSSGVGELREKENARLTVDSLLKNLPVK